MYLPVSLFHAQTARPISTKFYAGHPTNSAKFHNTTMTLPTQLHDPGVTQTPDHGRKNFALQKVSRWMT